MGSSAGVAFRVRRSAVRTGLLWLLWTAQAVFCQSSPTGQIFGSIQTADGKPVAQAMVAIYARPTENRAPYQAFAATVPTDKDGTFSAGGVPDGTYALCPESAGSTLLEPCRWGNELRVTVSGGQTVKAAPIRLIEGADLFVRVDDPKGTRAGAEGKVPGAALLLTVRGPNGVALNIPMTAKDKGGFDHHILVPPGTDLVMGASSDYYLLADSVGVAVSKLKGLSVAIHIPANVKEHKQVLSIQ